VQLQGSLHEARLQRAHRPRLLGADVDGHLKHRKQEADDQILLGSGLTRPASSARIAHGRLVQMLMATCGFGPEGKSNVSGNKQAPFSRTRCHLVLGSESERPLP